MPFFGIFIDLRKAFNAMDGGQCLSILSLHRVGPHKLSLIHNYGETATKLCRTKGNYGCPFKAGLGVTQGGPLLAMLFNIIINSLVHTWMQLTYETLDDPEGKLANCIEMLFAIFYVDNGCIASRNADFLQEELEILVKMFKRADLTTNTKNTQTMVCTPGR